MNKRKILNLTFILILILYPLRHIAQGISFTDTGYNYANFQYMGFEHMDPMWLFSTYLSNCVGYLLTKLPFALSLIGMNFYTGLFAIALGVMGYLFCVKKLGIPMWITFMGEMAALSLCWCPTALLYNYLTYVLLLACVVMLYSGLTGKGNIYLFVAGICLGTNILVRFSNLPEAALIVAVWAYSVLEWQENRKKSKAIFIGQAVKRTLVCFAGYLSALIVLFGYIHIRYGINNYISAIQKLFAMTDNATDYKATSMIMGLVDDYVQSLYWSKRICVFVIAGMIIFICAGLLIKFMTMVSAKYINASKGAVNKITCGIISIAKLICVLSAAYMVKWLYERGFCAVEIFKGGDISYGQILWPTVVFLFLTIVIGVVRILTPNVTKEEKLISGLVILIILITPIGSNNKTFPSWNNMFVVAPYAFWEIYLFVRRAKDIKVLGMLISPFPAKCVVIAFIAVFGIQAASFGVDFVFAEGTGARNMSAKTDNNAVLRGVSMQPERAEWMEEISGYISDNDLTGNDVILYGDIPSLSFYLQMPSAFNPWSDLTSYSIESFEEAILKTENRMEDNPQYRPVIILENDYAECYEELANADNTPKEYTAEMILENILGDRAKDADIKKKIAAEKFSRLLLFIDKYQYSEQFRNEKFALLVSE